MSDDMQMVRGAVEGGYNLAIGEPVLIRQRLRIQPITLDGLWEYPGFAGSPALIEELRALYPQYQHVVVATGAKQGVAAAMYALIIKKHRDCEVIGNFVSHRPPYWPSYLTLAHSVRATLLKDGERDWCVRCVTSPNNPDGTEHLDSCDIWDAVYAHQHYGWRGDEPEHVVRIGSAAKMLGLAGVRIGWLLTNDAQVAHDAAYFIEAATSGAPVSSQLVVAAVLRDAREGRVDLQDLLFARGAMVINGDVFRYFLRDHCEVIRGVPDINGGERGMYAYFKVRDPARFAGALESTRIALVSGRACGESEDGWWRMNMMQDMDVTEAALRRLSEALK